MMPETRENGRGQGCLCLPLRASRCLESGLYGNGRGSDSRDACTQHRYALRTDADVDAALVFRTVHGQHAGSWVKGMCILGAYLVKS